MRVSIPGGSRREQNSDNVKICMAQKKAETPEIETKCGQAQESQLPDGLGGGGGGRGGS